MLEDVATLCPNLQQLFLHATPHSTDRLTEDLRTTLQLPEFLKKCPALKELVISRGEVVSRGQFVRLVRERHLKVRKPESKILILKDEEFKGRERCGPLCSVSVLRSIVPLGAPWIVWDEADTRRCAVGEAATVRKWCEAFCAEEP